MLAIFVFVFCESFRDCFYTYMSFPLQVRGVFPALHGVYDSSHLHAAVHARVQPHRACFQHAQNLQGLRLLRGQER